MRSLGSPFTVNEQCSLQVELLRVGGRVVRHVFRLEDMETRSTSIKGGRIFCHLDTQMVYCMRDMRDMNTLYI